MPHPAFLSSPACLQSLAYAHAAAAVRTCAYRLRPPVVPGELPYLQTTAAEVTDILTTGTCLKLEQFRWVRCAVLPCIPLHRVALHCIALHCVLVDGWVGWGGGRVCCRWPQAAALPVTCHPPPAACSLCAPPCLQAQPAGARL